MKESGEDHLKGAIYESTLSTAGAVTPRIVISSESEKSFLFAVKQKMWG